MDIKSKKCKIVTVWAAFFLSICLLAESAAGAVRFFTGNNSVSVEDAFAEDYQETQVFRSFISDKMQTFLSMAAGGTIDWYNPDNYIGESWKTSWAGDVLVTNTEAVEGLAQEYAEGYEYVEEQDYTVTANQIHELIKNDKNLLYDISYNNKSLYSNDDDKVLEKKNSPDYNFYLSFVKGKAEIIKDKSSVDIYGDGIFRDDSKWDLPGYSNYTVDDKTKKAEVRLAIRKTPVNYVRGNYSESGFYYGSSSLYDSVRRLEDAKKAYIADIVKFLAALILLVVYLKLRKYKKDGDRLAAGITQKIWIECKVAVVVLIFASGIASLFGYAGFYYGGAYYEYAREVVYPTLLSLSDGFPCFLVVFWVLYLFANDLKYNRNKEKKSLIKDVQKLFRTRNMKYPFQKRMICRFVPVMGTGIILAVIAVVGCFIAAGILYYNSMMGSFLMAALPVFVIALLVGMMRQYALDNRKLAAEIGALVTQIEKIHDGNMTEKLQVPSDSEVYDVVEQLNDIQKGMDTALTERMKSEQMKVELVSNVSHDIKTPLTSIISYVELMKQEENLPEDVKDYVRILDLKSQRLKTMVQDVFDISKAASRQLPVNLEDLDLGKLLRQTLADMEEQIEKSSVIVKTQIPAEAVMIHSDGSRMYRVFQNLLQNALKYSLDGSRVFITLKVEKDTARTTVKNISQKEIPSDIDFTARFVRGDESRTDGGSGLGLSIARSFTEACGGKFRIDADADLFVVTIELPVNS